MTADVNRNAPCPCGSGKKYKQCCLRKPGGGGAPAIQPGKGSDGLTADELAVCKAMGHTPEAWIKARDGEKEEAA